MPRSNGYLRIIPPADTYFTHAETQWEALYEGYELTESASAELLKRRHQPQWTGRQDIKEWLHLNIINQMMPQAFRGAFLIALWATYETTIKMVGATLHRFDRSTAPFSPPRGRDWLRWARTYYANDLRFSLFPPDVRGIQNEVFALQRIRHVFVHGNGLQAASGPQWRLLRNYARKHRKVIRADRGYLAVTPEFVRGSFKTMGFAIAHVTETGREKLAANPDFIEHETGWRPASG